MPALPTLIGLIGLSVRPGPGEARSWLRRELDRPEYQQDVVDRIVTWLRGLWDELTRSALDATPLSTAAAVLVLVVLVVVVLLVVARVRRDPAGIDPGRSVPVSADLTAEQHRAAAESAMGQGAFDAAIVEGFRALAAAALDRGHVREGARMTARELTTALRPAFEEHAADLDRSSELFDRVFYGGQRATREDARSVLDLEADLRATRPGRPSPDRHPPHAAVPG
jgi:Domain of unknown function (DUF4129)